MGDRAIEILGKQADRKPIEALKRSIAGCRPCRSGRFQPLLLLWFAGQCCSPASAEKFSPSIQTPFAAWAQLLTHQPAGREASASSAQLQHTIEVHRHRVGGQAPDEAIQGGRTGDQDALGRQTGPAGGIAGIGSAVFIEALPARAGGFTDPKSV